MSKFNSRSHNNRKFNASKKKERQPREVARLFPMPNSGQDGVSVLSTDPRLSKLSRQRKFARHLLFGCEGEVVEGKNHADGKPVRKCAGCRGTMGPTPIEKISRRTAQLAGITRSSKDGTIHFPGDGCARHGQHATQSLIGNEPTLADYSMIPLKVPGRKKPVLMHELLHNAGKIQIGSRADGSAIYPGDVTDPRTGSIINVNAALRHGIAAADASAGMNNLIEAGETDLSKYFEVAQDTAHVHFQTKRKELDRDDPDGEQFVGIMQGAPVGLPLHVATNKTLHNIRQTLGDDAVDSDDPYHHHLWNQMGTASITQAFDVHNTMNGQLNPLGNVTDVQHGDEAAKSKEPGVREAFFASTTSDLGDVGNAQALGNIAKKDTSLNGWADGSGADLVNRLVRDHKESKMVNRVQAPIRYMTDFTGQTDQNLMEEIAKNQPRFTIGYE